MDEIQEVGENSWFAWSHHVLKELERGSDCQLEIKKEINEVKIEIAKLKVKAGIWGAIGGAIPILAGLGFWVLTKGG